MMGSFQGRWNRIRSATRPVRFAGRTATPVDIGPVTLHAKVPRNRSERGFDAVVVAYMTTIFVATMTGILARVVEGPFLPLFVGATGLTAIYGIVRIFSVNRKVVGSFLMSIPLLIVGLPLMMAFLGMMLTR